MEALNAIGLKPICAIPDQRAKPKKVAPNFPFFKFSNSKNNTINPQNIREGLAKKLHGGLVLLASGLTANIASALTYEEALELSVDSNSATDFDAGSVVETIVNNPILVAGGVALIAVPLVLSQILGGKPKAFGVESAKSAYAKLGEDPNALLLDIRPSKDVRVVGSPDINGLKKKPVSVVYNGEDKPGFLQKLSLRFKEPENTTLYILDKFDGNSELVAELVTANGFKSAYAIKDGAEGPRGWQNSGLPWIEPPKAFSFDFGGLTEAFGDAADALPVTLGIAAAAGFGVLAFTEIETVLQLLGSAALIQVISKKLLYAEERKQTLKQLDEFLTTKVAPKELVADIKQIGSALLPVTLTSRALPAPTEPATTPEAPAQPVPELPAEVATNNTVLKAEAAPDTPAEPATTPEAPAQPAPELPAEVATNNTVLKAEAAPDTPAEPASESSEEAAPQPPPEIDSVPSTEAKVVSQPRPLSPYAAYPDFKPPSSPCPSQP